jgi:hypothetical protein
MMIGIGFCSYRARIEGWEVISITPLITSTNGTNPMALHRGAKAVKPTLKTAKCFAWTATNARAIYRGEEWQSYYVFIRFSVDNTHGIVYTRIM